MGDTSIRVSEELADELYGRKQRGDSYEDVIWRLIDAAEGDSSRSERERERDPPNEPEQQADATPASRAESSAEQAPLAGVEFPGTRDRDECEAAVYAALAFLEEQGRATMREIVANVMPEHSLGYDVPELESGSRYRGAWWRKVVKPGLETLPSVEKPPSGGSEWRFTGTDAS